MKQCTDSLRVVDGKIVFSNKDSALLFANNFLLSQMNHWGGFEATARFHIFASVLKRAINLKVIEFNDLYVDDEFVLDKLEKSNDKEIQRRLGLLSGKSLAHLPKGKEKVVKKFRYVDPEFVANGTLIKLSNDDAGFARRLASMKKINQEGIVLPLVD